MRKIFWILLFFIGSFSNYAQRKFPISNFTPRDYGKNHSAQNWGIARDRSGVLYFGNDNGLLVYDGIRWSFIPVVNGKKVFSIAIDKNDNLFIGSYGEFGWIPRNESGYGEYQSLNEKLSVDDKKFSQVWRVFCLNEKEIVFQAQEELIFFDYKNCKVVKPQNSFHLASFDGEKLFVRERNKGITCYEKGKWNSIQTELPFDTYGLFAVLPFNDKKRSLWVTQELGLFVFNSDNSSFAAFAENKKEEILGAEIIGGIKLYNGFFALNSVKKGVLIFDEAGNFIQNIDASIGLRENNVVSQCLDVQGNLWLSHSNGLAKVQLPSRFEIYDWHDGFESKIHKVLFVGEECWAASDAGLLKWQNASLIPIALGGETVWDLAAFKSEILLATPHGLYLFSNNTLRQISKTPCRSIHVTKNNQIICGTLNGIEIFDSSLNNIYQGEFLLSEALGVASILNKNGEVEFWVSALGELAKVTDDGKNPLKIEIMDSENGLPRDWMVPFEYKNALVLGTNYGLYTNKRSTKDNKELFENLSFPEASSDASFHFLLEDSGSNTLAAIVNNKVILNKGGKSLSSDFLCLEMGRKNALATNAENLALATDEGLVLYHQNNDIWNFTGRGDLILRKFAIGEDSVMFNGSVFSEFKIETPVSYKFNTIKVSLGCSQFSYPDKNHLHFLLLQGSDTVRKGNSSGLIEIQNLSEGDYYLVVQGEDVWNHKFNPLKISFAILPPWYRTKLAYFSYLILLILLIYISGKIFSYNLKQANKKLEGLVQIRTAEIAAKNDELHLQNEKILEQKQEITDSINYAKRIQMAVLVPESDISKSSNPLFILYRPKDIVSGDFYWYRKINEEEYLIACADCTGHGVPGGFMSMICTEKLNEALSISKVPGEILHHTNVLLKEALRQDGEQGSTKDGMEIALLHINKKSSKVLYSGANRFLWIVRNNSEALDEIKPVKQGIGGVTPNNQIFDTHTIQMNSGDLLYMSSDGYADQFGGTDTLRNGKKFMTKNFKTLILQIKNEELARQKEILNSTIEKWKGDYEQVDDILVIGLKF